MTYIHKNLASGQWFKMTLIEQMANIGSEVERAILWKKKDKDSSWQAFSRAIELIDLTIADPKNKFRLKELTRLREIFCDYYFGENQYFFPDSWWQKYFFNFNYALRKDY